MRMNVPRLRFSDPFWRALRRHAVQAFRGRRALRRGWLLVAGSLALVTFLLPGSWSTLTGASGETPPRFAIYPAPAPLGRDAGEPSIGVSHSAGNLGRPMFIAGLETLRVTYDECTSPPADLWEDKSFTTTSIRTVDPVLFTDSGPGRTFVSQLAGKTSLMAYTDDEGENWTPVPVGSGLNSGVDHQTVGAGPFPASDPIKGTSSYPNAVYYCSQDAADASCALSRDGGNTFGPAVPIYTIAECGGLHGQVQVAPDGTVYVPNPSCNRQGNPLAVGSPGIVRSLNAGVTWDVHAVTGAAESGSSDPALGIGADDTLYFGYEDGGLAKVAVSHDRGDSWTSIRDVGAPFGLKHIVFPQVVAGDAGRAAISFLGTTFGGPGNLEGEDPDVPAVWYLYIAVTYDGGSTWTTTLATPNDPVQRGPVCGLGPTCACCRNLLDFNDITIDKKGRVVAAFADGCVGSCVNGGPNSGTAVASIARQVGGRPLLGAFDPLPGEKPSAVRLVALFKNGAVALSWDEPDDRGSTITSYNVYRRRTDLPGQSQALLASIAAPGRSYTDAALVAGQTYAYEVTAVSSNGEGARCREIGPVVPPPRHACETPGDLVSSDAEGDQTTTSALDILSLHISEPAQADRVDRLVFTLKVKDLTAFAPGNAWVILWNRPRPDADFDRDYVAMRATGPNTAAFKYGKVSPPNVNQGTDMGDADSGSFAPDGTIVITVANSKVDGATAGVDLNDVEVRTFAANVSGQPVSQASADDFSSLGTYTLVGNASCDPRPFALDDTATTPEALPVTINVLANDIDGNGDPLTVTGATDPPHGATQVNADGTITYAPDAFFAGTDTFDYAIRDPGGLSDLGTVRVVVFRSAPLQSPIQDDAAPDQVNGVDKDGNYRLAWTFPFDPVRPCRFRIEEASTFTTIFSDGASSPLVAGSNAVWTGDPNWISSTHPDTQTTGYSVVYTDNLNASLTMKNDLAVPVGPTKTALFFDAYQDTEENFDYVFVDASRNGGPFETLASWTGAFSGKRVVDLSDLAGSAVKIRFRLASDALVSSPVYLGWFIDNIEVKTLEFFAIGATSNASTYQFDVANRPSGAYTYRIAGMFGPSCTTIGPYSNLRDITVDRLGQPQPVPPTADFVVTPNPATVNQSVTFDGSPSHDNDGVGSGTPIVRYFWTFGDGATATTNGPVISHAYSAEGTYRATLTVTDNDGQTGQAEALVEVTGPPVFGQQRANGAGWIPRAPDRAEFGFNVTKMGTSAPEGHLNYNDKQGKVKVQSALISTFTISGNRATFTGPCTVNKVSGFTFTVDAFDNGSGPTDVFQIRLSNGYQANGNLGGGNILIRKK
jgi:Big-like domain-containing protein/PKD domain-containing protein/fibronectin type III domain protein